SPLPEGHAEPSESSNVANEGEVRLLTEVIDGPFSPSPPSAEAGAHVKILPGHIKPTTENGRSSQDPAANFAAANDDLGDVFGRVLALSLTLDHPGFEKAITGFADCGRVYLVYPDQEVRALSLRPGGSRMDESAALHIALQ